MTSHIPSTSSCKNSSEAFLEFARIALRKPNLRTKEYQDAFPVKRSIEDSPPAQQLIAPEDILVIPKYEVGLLLENCEAMSFGDHGRLEKKHVARQWFEPYTYDMAEKLWRCLNGRWQRLGYNDHPILKDFELVGEEYTRRFHFRISIGNNESNEEIQKVTQHQELLLTTLCMLIFAKVDDETMAWVRHRFGWYREQPYEFKRKYVQPTETVVTVDEDDDDDDADDISEISADEDDEDDDYDYRVFGYKESEGVEPCPYSD